MFWLGTKKQVRMAEAALEQTRGLLARFPTKDLDLSALEKSIAHTGRYIGDVGSFAVVLRGEMVEDIVSKSGLQHFVPSYCERRVFNVEVSTAHSGDYGYYHVARVKKTFSTLDEAIQWLVGA